MTQILRQSTQIKVVIGPVVAVGDGFTPVTTLSLGSADEAEIIKSDAGTVTDISAATFAAITSADGYYNLTLTTSHTDTVGLMTVLINDDSLCLPVKATFQVIEEAVYDALYAASATGYQVPIWAAANSTVNLSATTIKTATDVETDTQDIQSRLPAALVNSRMDCTIDGTGMETGAVDAILNRDASASTTNSTLGAIINDWENGGRLDLIVDDILVDTGTTIPATLGTPSDLGSGASVALNLTDIHNHTTDIVDATTIFSSTADSGTTTTLVDSALTQADADYWVGDWVKFTSGNLIGQVRLITDFVPGTDTITFAPATTQAVSTHNYVIIPAARTESVLAPNVAHGGGTATITLEDLTVTGEFAMDTMVVTSGLSANMTGNITGTLSTVTNLTNLPAITANWLTAAGIANDAITAAKIANGAIDAATFAADVDAEILSYLVDDATRIDASALNTATGTTIPAILDDTDLIDDGTSGLAKIATDVAAILVDTAVIGAAGAGLTAIIGADGDTLKSLSDQIDGLSTSAAPQLLLNTTIATLASQVSFTLTAGSADNDAYNGAIIVVTDQSTATQKAVGTISDYVGSTKTITLSADPAIFSMAVGDTVDILAAISSAPTVTQIRQEMDSNSTQLAAIVADTNELQTDWANGGRLDLILDARASQTSVDTIDGIVDAILLDTAEIGAAGAGLTAIQLPSNGLANVTAWTVAITGNITGNLSGSVGSVSGAVGSVTGNVGGNVTGSVGSVLGGINTTAGVITTLDGLDTAQDSQHSTTQGLVTTVDTVVDAVKLKTDNLPASPAAVGSAMTLTTAYDLYHADINFAVDEANTRDEYTVTWFKNGVRQASVSSGQIQVVKRVDGTDLIAATNMTQIASTGSWKYDATTTARTTAGEAVLVIVTATIDAGTRTFSRVVSRDSEAAA